MRFDIEYAKTYDITEDHYMEVLEVIQETIAGAQFYSGTICALFPDGVEWELSMTACIHWDDFHIVPIWWDFVTKNDGQFLDNNFELDKLKLIWTSGASE